MNETEQRQAIAKRCGWQVIHGWWVHPNEVKDYHSGKPISRLPNYLGDLNAMHEAEGLLTKEQRFSYAQILLSSKGIGYGGGEPMGFCFPVVHATASQRAEAFLKTLSLWEQADEKASEQESHPPLPPKSPLPIQADPKSGGEV